MSTEKNKALQAKQWDTEKQEEKQRDWSKFRQHAASLIANLATVSGGAALGWTSPALPLLQDEENDSTSLHVSLDEGSWISSLLAVGALIGALPAGIMADKLGRKKAILCLALPYIIGWLCIIFAQSHIYLIYIGRFITGMALGATTVLVPQYSEEISEDNIRGALGVYLDFNLCNGNLLINVFGAFLPYTIFTICAACLPIIFFLSFIWMPESPVYFIIEDRMDDAAKSLTWLRKGKRCYDVNSEILYLKESLIEESDECETKRSLAMIIKEFLKKGITLPSTTLKAVAIVYVLMFFQPAQGIDAVIFYSVSIFQNSGLNMSPNVSSIIIAAFQSGTDLVSSLIVDRVGRKPMLLTSAVITALSHAVLSVYFHFKDNDHDVEAFTWVPIVALIVFVTGFTLGFSPLPWLIMSELVPTRSKAWATSGAVFLNWSMVFLVTKQFPEMIDKLGSDVTYGTFSIMCVCGFIFVFLCVPETNNKSREEIQEALRGKKKS